MENTEKKAKYNYLTQQMIGKKLVKLYPQFDDIIGLTSGEIELYDCTSTEKDNMLSKYLGYIISSGYPTSYTKYFVEKYTQCGMALYGMTTGNDNLSVEDASENVHEFEQDMRECMESGEAFSFDESFNDVFYDLVDDLLEDVLRGLEVEAEKELIKEGYLAVPTMGEDPKSVADYFSIARYLLATESDKISENGHLILSPATPHKAVVIKEILKSPVLYTTGAREAYDLVITPYGGKTGFHITLVDEDETVNP